MLVLTGPLFDEGETAGLEVVVIITPVALLLAGAVVQVDVGGTVDEALLQLKPTL